jgi:hypothetical protein
MPSVATLISEHPLAIIAELLHPSLMHTAVSIPGHGAPRREVLVVLYACTHGRDGQGKVRQGRVGWSSVASPPRDDERLESRHGRTLAAVPFFDFSSPRPSRQSNIRSLRRCRRRHEHECRDRVLANLIRPCVEHAVGSPLR